MKITITATLTDEQADILAREQGWEDTINSFEMIPGEEPKLISSIPNPETQGEKLRAIYESIVIENATYNYTKFFDKNGGADTTTIKESVKNSITSSIE